MLFNNKKSFTSQQFYSIVTQMEIKLSISKTYWAGIYNFSFEISQNLADMATRIASCFMLFIQVTQLWNFLISEARDAVMSKCEWRQYQADANCFLTVHILLDLWTSDLQIFTTTKYVNLYFFSIYQHIFATMKNQPLCKVFNK